MATHLLCEPEHEEMVKPDSEVQSLIATSPLLQGPKEIPDPVTLIHLMREGWSAAPEPTPHENLKYYKSSYETRDGTTLRILVYRPGAATEKLPLLILFHGGGMCVGSPEGNSALCQTLAVEHNIVVISPQYRLGPEFPFPTGMDDSYDALTHIVKTAASHGADPGLGLLLGGESAGAVISAILSLQARDEKLDPPVTGTWLAAGSFISPSAVPEEYKIHYLSRFDETCLQSPMLSEAQKNAFDSCFKPDYTSPKYRASIWPGGHKGLGRTYFQACGMDINRDDSYIYRHMLAKQGVETKLDSYPGVPHCFWVAFPEAQMGRKWKEDTKAAFQWLLRKE